MNTNEHKWFFTYPCSFVFIRGLGFFFNTGGTEEGTEVAEFFYSVLFSVIFVDSVVKEFLTQSTPKEIRGRKGFSFSVFVIPRFIRGIHKKDGLPEQVGG